MAKIYHTFGVVQMNLKFLFLLCAMLITSWAWADDVSLTQDGSEWYVNVPNSGTYNNCNLRSYGFEIRNS